MENPGKLWVERTVETMVEIALEPLIYSDCNLENSLKDNALLSPSQPDGNQRVFWPDVSEGDLKIASYVEDWFATLQSLVLGNNPRPVLRDFSQLAYHDADAIYEG